MEILEQDTYTGHEKVLFGRDVASGYRGIIAIHSTARGPAVGGTRFWNYSNDQEALADALRLSRAMSYKNALAGLPLGGGKSVIIGDNKTRDRETIFRAHGRFIDTLAGRYIAGEDVGTSPSDIAIARTETKYVAGLPGGSGDPSPATAFGVFRAMQAASKYLSGSEDLSGMTVALQGCGHVGYHLAKCLHDAGVKLIVTDVEEEKLARVVDEFGASAVSVDEIFGVRADIFAPCALGGIINDETIPQFRVRMICGATNNQLLEARHAQLLAGRDILYVPDYAANAGGIINGCIDLLSWDAEQTARAVEGIYDTILMILENAEAAGITTSEAADRLAEARLRQSA
jgi:leucine dehydrogenase